MGECNRCGACCRVIPVIIKGQAPETTEWLKARGAIVDPSRQYLIIPHTCEQLREEKESGKTSCALHGTDQYPLVCARYHGFGNFYKPPGCGYVRGA